MAITLATAFHVQSNCRALIRWLNPGDYLGLNILPDSKARLYEYENGASTVLVDDDFGNTTMSLTYDTECDQGGSMKGNLTLDTAAAAARQRSRSDRRASLGPMSQGLTDDGVFKFVYDAWNP